MIYLKLIPNDFKVASRDKRELAAVRELGYEVRVIDRTKEKENYCDLCDGYEVYHISTRRLGVKSWMNIPNRIIAVFSYIFETIQTDASIISGHDYIMLAIAYIANLFKRRKAKLIYDSHEFELHRFAPNRTETQRKLIKAIESFLIRRVDLVLMVGDKIADCVQELYCLKTRPTVVRNIPSFCHQDVEEMRRIRKDFLRHLGIDANGTIFMFHGGIAPKRGIEYAVKILSYLPNSGLVIMGYESYDGMIMTLKKIAQEYNVENRVFFKDAVPVQKLMNYVGAVDIELILEEGDTCLSYSYSLPNKFFESIQAMVPMISTGLPEVEKLIEEYDIGLTATPKDEKSIADAAMRLINDRELYARFKNHLQKAREELCWEKESMILKKAISQMMRVEVYD